MHNEHQAYYAKYKEGIEMKGLIIGSIYGMVCYVTGLIVGKMRAEEDIRKKRDELGLDEESSDGWDELFKE